MNGAHAAQSIRFDSTGFDRKPPKRKYVMTRRPSDVISIRSFTLVSSLMPSPMIDQTELRFTTLLARWRRETSHLSSMSKRVFNLAHLEIIGMGTSALPFIFRELENPRDYWFVALSAITGEQPVPPGMSFDEGVKVWRQWATDHAS